MTVLTTAPRTEMTAMHKPAAALAPAAADAPRLFDATLISMEPVSAASGPRMHVLRLFCPGWPEWQPGQFVMLRPQEGWSPLVWGRPFSICDVTDGETVLFFQETGRGTQKLGDVRGGARLSLWGPLGNGFTPPSPVSTLLLAGGMGIAPFLGYARRYKGAPGLSLEFGHRPPLSCYPFESIAACIPAAAHHEKGPDDLARFLSHIESRIRQCRAGLVLACGPMPFLRAVSRFCREAGARAQLSLESRMACGVGACLGCVVKSAKPHHGMEAGWPVQICLNGPVFWADELELG